MPTLGRTFVVVAWTVLAATPLAAQGAWVGHQDPCRVSTGHFLVKSAVLYLKQAVETRFPDQRDGRLNEAYRVLLRAFTEAEQGDNAAAWYYLGRYYVERADPVGADSAFRRTLELAPECQPDVARYTGRLAALALAEALTAWGAGHRDSAVSAFRLARGLDPGDAEIPLYASIMYATMGETDSAAALLAVGLKVAETDTAHATRMKQAELEVARAYETRAWSLPAVQTVAQTRARRDSTAPQVAPDSALRARMLADVAEIRARGRHLDAQSLATFQRESTLVENRLTATRRTLDSLTAKAAADSQAAVAALAPAIRYYRRYGERYPDDATAALQLLRLETAAGDEPAVRQLVARLADGTADNAALVQAALGLYGDGLAEPAGTLLKAVLARNPFDHRALSVLVHVRYATGEAEALRAVADRLVAIDPLNPSGARAMALAWDLAGQPDSVRRYLAQADTGLGWHVTITQFASTERTTSVNGSVRNGAGRTLPAITLDFEFLDAAGTVLYAASADIPAVEPRRTAPLSVRVEQGGAVAWRYRKR